MLTEAELIIAEENTARVAKLERLKDCLNELGWTQTKFAKETEYNVNTVTRWMGGHTEVPTIVLRYLDALLRIKNLEIPPAVMRQLENLVKQQAGSTATAIAR